MAHLDVFAGATASICWILAMIWECRLPNARSRVSTSTPSARGVSEILKSFYDYKYEEPSRVQQRLELVRPMTLVDTESRWTCTNTECPEFDQWLHSTTLQSLWWQRQRIEPDCPECHEAMSFIAWIREDDPETIVY